MRTVDEFRVPIMAIKLTEASGEPCVINLNDLNGAYVVQPGKTQVYVAGGRITFIVKEHPNEIFEKLQEAFACVTLSSY